MFEFEIEGGCLSGLGVSMADCGFDFSIADYPESSIQRKRKHEHEHATSTRRRDAACGFCLGKGILAPQKPT